MTCAEMLLVVVGMANGVKDRMDCRHETVLRALT